MEICGEHTENVTWNGVTTIFVSMLHPKSNVAAIEFCNAIRQVLADTQASRSNVSLSSGFSPICLSCRAGPVTQHAMSATQLGQIVLIRTTCALACKHSTVLSLCVKYSLSYQFFELDSASSVGGDGGQALGKERNLGLNWDVFVICTLFRENDAHDPQLGYPRLIVLRSVQHAIATLAWHASALRIRRLRGAGRFWGRYLVIPTKYRMAGMACYRIHRVVGRRRVVGSYRCRVVGLYRSHLGRHRDVGVYQSPVMACPSYLVAVWASGFRYVRGVVSSCVAVVRVRVVCGAWCLVAIVEYMNVTLLPLYKQ
jgi:hypothetical protein